MKVKSKVIESIIAGSSVARMIRDMEENSITGIIKRLKINYTSEVVEQIQKGLKFGIIHDSPILKTVFDKSKIDLISNRQIIKPTYPRLEMIENSLRDSYEALEKKLNYWKQKYFDSELGWKTFVEKKCIIKKTDEKDN